MLPGRALSGQGVPPLREGHPAPDSAAPRGARVLLARPADRAMTVQENAHKSYTNIIIYPLIINYKNPIQDLMTTN